MCVCVWVCEEKTTCKNRVYRFDSEDQKKKEGKKIHFFFSFFFQFWSIWFLPALFSKRNTCTCSLFVLLFAPLSSETKLLSFCFVICSFCLLKTKTMCTCSLFVFVILLFLSSQNETCWRCFKCLKKKYFKIRCLFFFFFFCQCFPWNPLSKNWSFLSQQKKKKIKILFGFARWLKRHRKKKKGLRKHKIFCQPCPSENFTSFICRAFLLFHSPSYFWLYY